MKHVKLNRTANRPTNTLDRFFNENFLNENFLRDTWNRTFAHVHPAVNIVEQPDAFVIQVAAPGLAKEDFHLNLDKDILSVKVQKEAAKETEELKWHRKEFTYSSFERSFRLPETISDDKINARYENGVLFVSLPKRDEAVEKPAREISIS